MKSIAAINEVRSRLTLSTWDPTMSRLETRSQEGRIRRDRW